MLTGKHLIAGEWVSSSGDAFQSVNPVDGTLLPTVFHEAGSAEVNRAFASAVDAFNTVRGWKPERFAELLETISSEIMALGDDLLALASAESALPFPRLTGERGRTCGQLNMFAAMVREGSWVDATIETALPDRQPLAKPDLRKMLQPLGPVVVFGASNFPLAFSACGGDSASALAAGCPVIVKGHPGHPGTSELTAVAVQRALEKCKFRAGMFSLLQGRGNELGAALAQHPSAEAVGFTGSLRGGRALFNLAAARPRPIPVYAEMGSVNPIVILPAAMSERADALAEGLAGSALLGAGQFCTKPGHVFLIEGDHTSKFVSELTSKFNVAATFTLLNPGIRDAFNKSIAALQSQSNVRALVSGEANGSAGTSCYLTETTAQEWMKNPILHEETFGPSTLLIRCTNTQELFEALAHLEGQLTATVMIGDGEDQILAKATLTALDKKAGRVVVNGYPTGVEVCYAMEHGGPYPATTAPLTTSVGNSAILRFARPVAYQSVPDALLPPQLQRDNPLGITRRVNGVLSKDAA